MNVRGDFRGARLAAIIGGSVAAVVAMLLDFTGSTWKDRPMVGALVSAAIVIVLTVAVLDRLLEARHRARWATVRSTALHSIALEASIASKLLDRFGHSLTEPDDLTILNTRGAELVALGTGLRGLIAQWGPLVIETGGEDVAVFDSLGYAANAVDEFVMLAWDARTRDWEAEGLSADPARNAELAAESAERFAQVERARSEAAEAVNVSRASAEAAAGAKKLWLDETAQVSVSLGEMQHRGS